MQAGFGKQVDSPSATAEADVSDAQSVDSSLSRRGTGMSKKDTVCQVGKGPVLQLETGRDVLPVKCFLLSERVVYFFFFFFFFLIVFLYLAALGLPYNMWDLVSQSGIEPRPPAWEQGVLAPGPPGKSQRG